MATSQSPHAILVLDANPAYAEIYDRVLHELGDVEVAFFTNPFEALTWSDHHTPVLAVVDYRLNKMDGIQFIRHFRTRHRAEHVPIVMLTGVASPVLWQLALDEGASGYFIKPIESHRFLKTISGLMAHA